MAERISWPPRGAGDRGPGRVTPTRDRDQARLRWPRLRDAARSCSCSSASGTEARTRSGELRRPDRDQVRLMELRRRNREPGPAQVAPPAGPRPGPAQVAPPAGPKPGPAPAPKAAPAPHPEKAAPPRPVLPRPTRAGTERKNIRPQRPACEGCKVNCGNLKGCSSFQLARAAAARSNTLLFITT